MKHRSIGKTGIGVSPIALGCWPIAGMTSLDVTDEQSLRTVAACFDLGINFLDTAYAYGMDGESERIIAQAVAGRRDEVVIATKVGLEWIDGKRILDGREENLNRQLNECLRRLKTDHVELLYLHAPPTNVPMEEAAGAMRKMIDAGKVRAAGLSNCDVKQAEAFAGECPLSAVQPPYNMVMRGIESDLLPWCVRREVSVMVYWPLMKGLLAGRLPRDYVFRPGDGRAKYPMFQGQEWQLNQDLVERLRVIAEGLGLTVSQLVLRWTIYQPGITAALVGAKRPDQIIENAAGMGPLLSADVIAALDAALRDRGEPQSIAAV